MSTLKNELTKKQVRALLDYNPKTGEFTWKARGRRWFATDEARARWNGRFAGQPAITALRPPNYLVGTVLHQSVFAHRLAYLWMTGKNPKYVIPKDGDYSNTRWSNLNASDFDSMQRNSPLRYDNTSGHPGVWFENRTKKWCVAIGTGGGTRKGLGRYASKQEAIAVRQAASAELGYHATHGRKAS